MSYIQYSVLRLPTYYALLCADQEYWSSRLVNRALGDMFLFCFEGKRV